eukprot:2876076-Rhodomonas_salina.1
MTAAASDSFNVCVWQMAALGHVHGHAPLRRACHGRFGSSMTWMHSTIAREQSLRELQFATLTCLAAVMEDAHNDHDGRLTAYHKTAQEKRKHKSPIEAYHTLRRLLHEAAARL